MTKLFLITILILCLPLATALDDNKNWIAGNQESIILDVSPSSCIMIDEQNNSLTNYSTDGLNLTINGNNVTINTNPALMPGNYTLVCNYPTEETTTNTGGGGGGGYTTSWICGNWSECINNKMKRVCIQGTNKKINYTQSKSCVSETKEPEEKKVEKIKVEPEVIEKGEPIMIIPVVNNKTDINDVELPTEEEQGWVYLGIIIIIIVSALLGVIYFIGKSNSES